ncbi:MAG: hypothetical protein R3B13_13865 [Polyangiaceae bacterium]
MARGLRDAVRAGATGLGFALLLAAPRRSAAQAAEPTGTEDRERRVAGVQEVGVFVGALDYTEGNVNVFDVGATLGAANRPVNPYRTRGGWFTAQSQYAFSSWLALALRARLGSLTRGPPTVVPPDETANGGDPSALTHAYRGVGGFRLTPARNPGGTESTATTLRSGSSLLV